MSPFPKHVDKSHTNLCYGGSHGTSHDENKASGRKIKNMSRLTPKIFVVCHRLSIVRKYVLLLNVASEMPRPFGAVVLNKKRVVLHQMHVEAKCVLIIVVIT